MCDTVADEIVAILIKFNDRLKREKKLHTRKNKNKLTLEFIDDFSRTKINFVEGKLV